MPHSNRPSPKQLPLRVLPGRVAVCRLAPDEALPGWATEPDGEEMLSVTRTTEETSIVCREEKADGFAECQRGWRALKVEARLDFGLVGVLAGISAPLAEADISIFAISTYNTDYLLVREADLGRAVDALRQRGFPVRADKE